MTGLGKATERLVLRAAVVGAILSCGFAAAELPGLAQNGWHTWRVEAVDDTPEWCCYSWSSGRQGTAGCDLDKRRSGYGTDHTRVNTSDQIQIYALLESGEAKKIRALSPRCPVTSEDVITDLGLLAVDDSVEWLQASIEPRTDITSDALTGIAMHAGKRARDLLVSIGSSSDEKDSREEAIFWMAQLRISETGTDLRRMLLTDEDPDIRRHAAFAYSQSTAGDRIATLVKQGKEDKNADVRSQAWFWLAQTEAPESEAAVQRAIESAIAKDSDRDVREQAVFALSQLPEERAVTALIHVVENRHLSLDSREQALFWLAQSESDAALRFFERLISGP